MRRSTSLIRLIRGPLANLGPQGLLLLNHGRGLAVRGGLIEGWPAPGSPQSLVVEIGPDSGLGIVEGLVLDDHGEGPLGSNPHCGWLDREARVGVGVGVTGAHLAGEVLVEIEVGSGTLAVG